MKFTLLVCSYNPNKEWLAKALSTAQGLFDEYILVDDGSDEPILCPEGFTLFRKENGGLWTARNLGIKEATGDVICILDDDDEFIPEIVPAMKEFCQNNDSDVWIHNIQMFGNTDEVYAPPADKNRILENNQFCGSSWFKKTLWEELGGYQYPLAEDWDFWMRACKKDKKFIRFYQVFYRYRRWDGSVSAPWTGDKFLQIREDIINRYYA